MRRILLVASISDITWIALPADYVRTGRNTSPAISTNGSVVKIDKRKHEAQHLYVV